MTAMPVDDLPPLDVRFAQALAAKVSDAITAAAAGKPASFNSKKLVAKRVRPTWLPQYEVMDKYGFVLWDEILTILDRILVYPYIATYRKHLRDAPKEVLSAWQFHSHTLRVGEIYLVQDRTSALLEFLNSVAADCGLPVTDCRKSFESKFKKTFERRLRERHRLTHAHERPSAVSRLVDLSGSKWTGDEAEAARLMTDLLSKALPRLVEVSEAAGRPPPMSMEDIEALHEKGAEQEARQMLMLVAEALLATLSNSSSAAAEPPTN